MSLLLSEYLNWVFLFLLLYLLLDYLTGPFKDYLIDSIPRLLFDNLSDIVCDNLQKVIFAEHILLLCCYSLATVTATCLELPLVLGSVFQATRKVPYSA